MSRVAGAAATGRESHVVALLFGCANLKFIGEHNTVAGQPDYHQGSLIVSTRTGIVGRKCLACVVVMLASGAAHADLLLTPATYQTAGTIDLDSPSGGSREAFSQVITTPGLVAGAASVASGVSVPGQAAVGAWTTPSASSVPVSVTLPFTPAPAPLAYAEVDVTSDSNPQSFLNDYTQGSASAQVTYQMSIAGPTPTVDVLASWFLQASASPASQVLSANSNGGAGASFTLSYLGNAMLSDSVGFAFQPFSVPNVITSAQSAVVALTTGVFYNVTIGATASAKIDGRGVLGGPGGGRATNSALADPTFQIAGTVANASAYTISFSPGIGNGTTPVPLPGSAGLMAGALALMGVALRRRTPLVAAR